MGAKMHARSQGHDRNKYFYVNNSQIASNTKNLFHNHHEDCFTYFRSNVELKSTALSAVLTPMSS